MGATDEIVSAIDARLTAVHEEIASLESARAAMTSRPTPSRPSSPARASDSRNRRSRPATAVGADAIELLLAGSEGMASSAIAERTGGTRLRVLVLLRELEIAGRVRRTGARRGTQWHLITDEDRIAARAAELEAQRRLTG